MTAWKEPQMAGRICVERPRAVPGFNWSMSLLGCDRPSGHICTCQSSHDGLHGVRALTAPSVSLLQRQRQRETKQWKVAHEPMAWAMRQRSLKLVVESSFWRWRSSKRLSRPQQYGPPVCHDSTRLHSAWRSSLVAARSTRRFCASSLLRRMWRCTCAPATRRPQSCTGAGANALPQAALQHDARHIQKQTVKKVGCL